MLAQPRRPVLSRRSLPSAASRINGARKLQQFVEPSVRKERQRADAGTPKNFSESSQLDRKSTRLNSSHRCISYAVFCLKKKNNTNKRNTSGDSNATKIIGPRVE